MNNPEFKTIQEAAESGYSEAKPNPQPMGGPTGSQVMTDLPRRFSYVTGSNTVGYGCYFPTVNRFFLDNWMSGIGIPKFDLTWLDS